MHLVYISFYEKIGCGFSGLVGTCFPNVNHFTSIKHIHEIFIHSDLNEKYFAHDFTTNNVIPFANIFSLLQHGSIHIKKCNILNGPLE